MKKPDFLKSFGFSVEFSFFSRNNKKQSTEKVGGGYQDDRDLVGFPGVSCSVDTAPVDSSYVLTPEMWSGQTKKKSRKKRSRKNK